MTTHCDELIPLMLRAADGTIAPAERAVLDAHLATCTACAEALADQQTMRNALAALAVDAPVTHVGARVMATLRDEAARTAANTTWLDALDWRRWTWRMVPIAAALALAVAAVARPVETTSTSDTTSSTTPATTTMAASAALFSDDVSGADLLTLLLTANADQAVTSTPATTGAGEGR